jgi:hypothetical protein
MRAFRDYFQHVQILNLPSRLDRRQAMTRELAKVGLTEQAGSIEFFAALRPTRDQAAGWPGVGARGCFMSHLSVLQRARREGWPRVLIMEDDLEIDPRLAGWEARLVADLDCTPWGFVYLGHIVDLPLPAPDDGPALVRYTQPFPLAHFYAVSAAVYDPLVDYLEAAERRPAGHPDGGAMHVDGAYCMFRERHAEVQTLLVNPSLGHQRSSPSDITPRWWDRVGGVRELARGARRIRRWIAS